ncbi:hypothetical protein DFH27DRAFT_59787 [Peziza echinospora]|nr:hypothetical protein DFH27DRAFT_59787 [Peziza echinospora]
MEPSAVSTSPMEYSDLDVEIDDDDDDGEYEDAQTYHDIDDDDEMDDDEEGEEVDADAVDDDDDDEYDDEDSEDEVERRLGAAIRLRILNDGILEDGASIHIVSLPEGIRYQYHIESTRQDEAVIERSEEGVELMKGGDFGAVSLHPFLAIK